jgi:hypothetical protein
MEKKAAITLIMGIAVFLSGITISLREASFLASFHL